MERKPVILNIGMYFLICDEIGICIASRSRQITRDSIQALRNDKTKQQKINIPILKKKEQIINSISLSSV